MLATRFPRPPGDIGNPATFPFPVDYHTIEAARVDRVVRADGPAEGLAEEFLAGGQALVAAGASAITTSCGFLAPLQERLAAALPVPVIASALSVLPALRRTLGKSATIGVLTFDSRKLGRRHLPAEAGEVIVGGIEDGHELHRVISEDLRRLDPAAARADAVSAADQLRRRSGDLSAVVLECTNLAPYRAAIATAARCPVYDIRDAISLTLDGQLSP